MIEGAFFKSVDKRQIMSTGAMGQTFAEIKLDLCPILYSEINLSFITLKHLKMYKHVKVHHKIYLILAQKTLAQNTCKIELREEAKFPN